MNVYEYVAISVLSNIPGLMQQIHIRNELMGVQAQYAVHKYKSHRSIKMGIFAPET